MKTRSKKAKNAKKGGFKRGKTKPDRTNEQVEVPTKKRKTKNEQESEPEHDDDDDVPNKNVKTKSKIRTSTPKRYSRRLAKATDEDDLSMQTDEQEKMEIANFPEIPILNENVENSMNDETLNRNTSVLGNLSALSYQTNASVNFDINERGEFICTICQQQMDGIQYYNNEPTNGNAEEIVILDSRLGLFNGQEENEYSQEDTRAYNRITAFTVYCKNGHLCPFDSGLIEKDRNIYFSGYVKPIYNEDPSIKDGLAIAGKKFGPIVEWWSTGFDPGEQPRLGFTTEIGDYVLMEPLPEYASYMQSALTKTLISKKVIEFILQKPDASYEDLLREIQTLKIPNSESETFTEDNLMYYAPFICNQMMSFDTLASPDEMLLTVSPCIRRLIDLAGLDSKFKCAEKRRNGNIGAVARKDRQLQLYGVNQQTDNVGDGCQSEIIDAVLNVNHIKSLTPVRNNKTLKCESCYNCLRMPCKECLGCTQKKACRQKRCFWREIREANKEDEEINNIDVSSKDILFSTEAYTNKVLPFKQYKKEVALLGPPVKFEDGNQYFESANVSGIVITRGDFVSLRPDNNSVPEQIMKVAYIWENSTGMPKFHGIYYWRGKDTVLGEFAHPQELFKVSSCCDVPLFSIKNKVKVLEREEPLFWLDMIKDRQLYGNTFYCEKSFDMLTGRFCDLKKEDETARENSPNSYRFCSNEAEQEAKIAQKQSHVLNKIGEEENKITYEKIFYNNEEYFVGSTVYVKPRKLYFAYPMSNNNAKLNACKNEAIDDKKYPEQYRKANDSVKELWYENLSPLDIGLITQIFTMEGTICIKVKKFYRPENTHDGPNLCKKSSTNLLFWSDEESTIAFSHVVGKCYVVHEKCLNTNPIKWVAQGPDRFYFSKEYKNKEFNNVSAETYKGSVRIHEEPKEYPNLTKLKTLNLFAGCGGLALGLERSGLARISWAIEPDETAATVFQLNMKKTVVFNADVRTVLNAFLDGEEKFNNQKLPKEEDVEFLCASIPGKNFKSLENFKNSDIAMFIEYCYYYRPALFVMDADENLIKYNDYFKLTLSCLISIGFQVAFNVMQVGNFGAPQNRKRTVLLGASPGNILPKYPKNLHVFPKSLSQSLVVVDNKKYSPIEDWNNSAPFRLVTVFDAISDLPPVYCAFGQPKTDLGYCGKLLTHYQKLMRLNVSENVLLDHECKMLDALVQTRLLMLPSSVGSDWRNLPNMEITLSNGTYAKKLVYTHDDVDAGRSPSGDLRGVCSCANGGVCDLSYRQENTIIPWHLVHTAKRHKQWAGLYGRLQWDGFFGNITYPEPLGTEGPVIHPHEPRLVSVRECARSQGFPDDFKLGDTTSTHDKFRIIGQAPSPLLFICIGGEIVNALV